MFFALPLNPALVAAFAILRPDHLTAVLIWEEEEPEKSWSMKQNQSENLNSAASAAGHTALPDALPAHNYPHARSGATEPRVDPRKKPYCINELVILHGLSRRTVIRLYQNEPGRLMYPEPGTPQKRKGRRYRTILVPQHVYQRVKRRMEKHE
jgi:hypothetical protein